MIMSMVELDERKQTILYVIIERENLARMEKADPITLESIAEGGMLPAPRYPANFSVLIAYEPDSEELYKMAQRPPMLIRWLERGRKYIRGLDGKENSFKMAKELENADRTSSIPSDAEEQPGDGRETP